MQNRHEMAFAATEAAVQIRRLTRRTLQRTANEAQCVIERSHKLGCRYIGGDRRLRVRHTLGQAQHELPLVDVFRNVDQFFE